MDITSGLEVKIPPMVEFTLEQAMKVRRGSKGLSLLFL
jgi:hypothetical protein